jgi:hypothetical protein
MDVGLVVVLALMILAFILFSLALFNYKRTQTTIFALSSLSLVCIITYFSTKELMLLLPVLVFSGLSILSGFYLKITGEKREEDNIIF